MKLLKRLFILVVLCSTFGVVLFSPTTQNVSARRCCSTCPGAGDPVSAESVCPGQCAPDDPTCMQACIDSINSCYGYCMHCNYGEPIENSTRVACSMIQVAPHQYEPYCWTVYA